jgi:D-sedoheptulose 7-phosphate isomerase
MNSLSSTSDFRVITERYLASLRVLVDRLDLDAVERVVQRLRIGRDSGATLFIAGNGGSAATASHWVNDLGKAASRSGRRPMRVMGLADNVSWLTALANDEGYDRDFAGQLGNFGRPGDILAVISASGNSANLVRAVEVAGSLGMVTIGLLGFDGGVLKTMLDDVVWVETPKGEYGLVESMHTVICDLVTTCMIEDRAESSNP